MTRNLQWALLGAVLLASPLGAQDSRHELAIEPARLFPAMPAIAERGDWVQMERALEILSPLLVQVDAINSAKPGHALETAVATQDPEKVRAALITFVTAAIIELLNRAAVEPDSAVRRETIRVAFAEFISVSPTLKPISFELQRKAEIDFRRAYAEAGGERSQFVQTCESLVDTLARLGGGG